jgi:soluble lytic murein transglycosylase-like protein
MNRSVLVGVTLAAAVAIPSMVAADIFMYRSPNGTIHFSNAPAKRGFRRVPMESGFRYRPGRVVDRPHHTTFDRIISQEAGKEGVDPALVKAVIRAESGFVPTARSPKGALGLMQLMPATARMHHVWRAFDPNQNIAGGVKHLSMLLARYRGNERLALAAYNAGDGAVERYGGVPPYRETIEYIQRVFRFRDHYRAQF